jgi:hypothetical protein
MLLDPFSTLHDRQELIPLRQSNTSRGSAVPTGPVGAASPRILKTAGPSRAVADPHIISSR